MKKMMGYKGLSWLVMILSVCLVVAACGRSAADPPMAGQDKDISGNEQTESGAQTGAQTDDTVAGILKEDNSPAYTFADGVIYIQGYNAAEDRMEDMIYQIPQGTGTTLQTVLTAYNEEYKVPVLGGNPIEVNRITLTAGQLHLDFTESIYGNYGSGTEVNLLRNLFLAYFANVPEVEGISISVAGARYESGHMLYETDDVILRQDVVS